MSNNQPSHRAYVNLGTQDAPRYREVGALWPHRESNGFNLKLDLIPARATTIVCFENEPKGDTSDREGAR